MKDSTKSFLVAELFFIVTFLIMMISNAMYFTTAFGITLILSTFVYVFYKKYIFNKEEE